MVRVCEEIGLRFLKLNKPISNVKFKNFFEHNFLPTFTLDGYHKRHYPARARPVVLASPPGDRGQRQRHGRRLLRYGLCRLGKRVSGQKHSGSERKKQNEKKFIYLLTEWD